VLARALAKEPADRYPSAGDLGRAARAAAAGEHLATGRGSVATGAATPEQAEPTRIAPGAGATAVAAPAVATAMAPGAAATEHAGARSGGARGGAPRQAARPAAVKVQRGRGRKLAVGATVLVLAIPAVAVALWADGGSGTTTGPLGADEVRSAAESFADAYTHEDDAALRRVLTPAVRRVSPTDVQRGRASVVGEYHRQFVASRIEKYALDGLKVTGGPVGRAEGRYTVTSAGAAPLTGRIVFGVVRRDGKATIDLIATEPRA
jgi:hypothetical protein